MKNYQCEILKNEQLNKNIFNLVLKMPKDFNIKPGQFINIYIPNYLIGRPFSFEAFENQELSIIYKINGEGTNQLKELICGTTLNILGPLGSGFDTTVSNKEIVLIGAGVGLPPILNLYEHLKLNNNVKLIAAFTNEEDTFRLNQISKDTSNVILVQNSSKYPNLNPLQYLEQAAINFEYIYACGPTILLKLLDQKYNKTKQGQISIEERMGCGHGTCYGCSKKTKTNTNVLTCKDGPVFNLGVLLWKS